MPFPSNLPYFDRNEVQAVIQAALDEDIQTGDVTSISVIPENLRFQGVMRARHAMVVAGLPLAKEVFAMVETQYADSRLINSQVTSSQSTCQIVVPEGQTVEGGTVLMHIEGPARMLLTAERTALNFVQLLCGIATLTHTYAERIRGTGCTLLDTRKTIPGLRQLSKYATRCGGAQNHRMGLYDGILIKDNHIAVCGSVTEAVRRAKNFTSTNSAPKILVEIECDTLEQVAEAVQADVDIILLDNMTPAQLREGVSLISGRCKTEASGGVNLDTIRAIAESGVDYVSVGRITQSAPAADIGLDWS